MSDLQELMVGFIKRHAEIQATTCGRTVMLADTKQLIACRKPKGHTGDHEGTLGGNIATWESE